MARLHSHCDSCSGSELRNVGSLRRGERVVQLILQRKRKKRLIVHQTDGECDGWFLGQFPVPAFRQRQNQNAEDESRT